MYIARDRTRSFAITIYTAAVIQNSSLYSVSQESTPDANRRSFYYCFNCYGVNCHFFNIELFVVEQIAINYIIHYYNVGANRHESLYYTFVFFFLYCVIHIFYFITVQALIANYYNIVSCVLYLLLL